jgi:hypothetical protein
MKQCVYSIPCDCGRCYIGKTSRPLEVYFKEYWYNLTQYLYEKSKLAQHAYKEGPKICWKQEKVLQIEPNATCRKYKESALSIYVTDHPIRQPSLDISPIWTPITADEFRKLHTTLSSVDYVWKLCVMLVLNREFVSLVMTSILIILILAIAVKQRMDQVLGLMCEVLLMFMVYIFYLVLVLLSVDRD